MLWKTIVALIFAFAVSDARGQNIVCEHFCIPQGAFSADNVHRIRTFGGDVPSLKEARWHKTEPIIIRLGYYCLEHLYPPCPIDGDGDLSVARVFHDGEIDESYFQPISIRGKYIAVHMPVDQLELVNHNIILGTNDGSLYVLDIGNWGIGNWDTDEWERYARDDDIWDAGKWERVKENFSYDIHIAEGNVNELLLHPSEEWLLVAIDHERLFRFDLATQSVSEIELQTGPDLTLHALAFSDGGRLLATAGNGVIQIWDTDSWTSKASADLDAESLAKLLFTDDDSQLIVLEDATVSRWSLSGKTLNLLRELQSHPDKSPCRITDGDISLDGSLLMTVDECGQTRAWDLNADREIFIPQLDFTEEESPGTAIQFSPDGRFLVVGGRTLGWGLHFVYESA